MPEIASVTLTAPVGFASAADFQARATEATEAREKQHRREHQLEGGRFLGARILAQSPFARPAAGERRRGLSPRVAARDEWKRIEALGRWVEFQRLYRTAWNALQSGVRDVVSRRDIPDAHPVGRDVRAIPSRHLIPVKRQSRTTPTRSAGGGVGRKLVE